MARILLIEDDQILRENTKEILELAGHRTYTAEDGEKGIQLASKFKIDLILCDIIMPKRDGYSVLKELTYNPRTQHIPFIFLTAKTDIKDIRLGMNLGADDYITKPFDEYDLLESINSRLAKHALLLGKSKYIPPVRISIKNTEELRNYFLEHGEKIRFAKNELVYRQDQTANYVYLVTKGIIKTLNIDEYGKELITGIYHKNDFFGVYSFNKRVRYPEQALVIEKAKLLRIPMKVLLDIFKGNPEFTLKWAEDLSQNVIELKEHLLQTAYASVMKKTVNTILDFSEKLQFDKAELSKISRGDLANMAGISKESFIRCLSTLKQERLIKINGKNIEVLDLNKLKRIK